MDAVIILAVATSNDAGGFAVALFLAASYTCAQLLVVTGKSDFRLPLMLRTSTRAGAVGLLGVYSGFSLFFLVGLILTLWQRDHAWGGRRLQRSPPQSAGRRGADRGSGGAASAAPRSTEHSVAPARVERELSSSGN